MNEFEKACEVDTSDGFASHENVIEWLKDSKTATVTLSQGRYITKIKKLAKQYPDEVEIIRENKDGSLLAHIPVSYIKINNPPRREYTEEQRAAMAERLRKINKNVEEGTKC